MKKIKFSFIIITQKYNHYLKICLNTIINNLKDHPIEIIVISDEKIDEYKDNKILFYISEDHRPGAKRNFGISLCNGEWLVFLDDDCFIDNSFITNLINDTKTYENDNNFIGFGGPGLIPSDDNLFSKIADCFFCSFFGTNSGNRYKKTKNNLYKINDWLSANLILNKKKTLEVGCFRKDLWPGEDTHLLEKILENKQNYLIYNNRLYNYHYRRGNITKHLRQLFRYGYYRAELIKNFNKKNIKFYFAAIHNILLIFSLYSFFLEKNIMSIYLYFYIFIIIKYFFKFIIFNKKIF